MRVAFLGPAGTNSELALKEKLPGCTPVPCFSIPDVFQLVSQERAEAGFVPLENVIQGPVTETFDALFEYHGQILVSDSHVMRISNALGVLKGDRWPRKIDTVLSHEQALRQCSKSLAKLYPEGRKIPVSSTAAAVEQLVNEKQLGAAVIGAASTLEQHNLWIVDKDLSDLKDNQTRFVLIKSGNAETCKWSSETTEHPHVTSIVVNPGRDRKGLLFEILQVLSIKNQVNILTIHSRPDTKGGVVFYLDLEGSPNLPAITSALNDLRKFCADITAQTAEIYLLGAYPYKPFHALPFASIGIVGSAGLMGQWFTRFFESIGIKVLPCDLESGLPLRELAEKADVILLSLPMSKIKGVCSELIPNLRSGQLVIENCSIKQCALPFLLANVPEGVELLGMHTMFGPDVSSLTDQNLIITRTEKSSHKSQAVEDLFYKHGARIRRSSISEHDAAGAFVQSGLQLTLLILIDAMSSQFASLDKVEFLSTPNFRAVLQVIKRVIDQSPELVKDLQSLNPDSVMARNRILEALFKHVSALNQGSPMELERTLKQAKEFLRSVP